MGNKNQSPQNRSSSEISSTSESGYSRQMSRSNKVTQLLQQNLQITRNQMIDAWINLLCKMLKKKSSQEKNWQPICSRISQTIKKFTRSSYWKVFQSIDSWSSKQSVEYKAKLIKQSPEKTLTLKKAKSTFIDTTKLTKKMSKRGRQKIQKSEAKQIHTNKQIKENIVTILQNEFQQAYHPFSAIKKIFIEDIKYIYREISYSSGHEEDQTTIHILREDFKAIVLFLLKSCQIYKQCIQTVTNLKDKGYNKFISKIIINFLFDSPSNFHPLLIKIIKIVNRNYIQSVSLHLKQSVNINKFHIKKQLQIQGNYIKSMIMLSEINTITHPKDLITFFQTLKSQIQHDIQFFNETFDRKEQTLIDGDNLLSIICYMLCKMKGKLPDIHAQLVFMEVVYGDSILTEYDSASYIVTAMMAAIDYLKSEQFFNIMK